MLLGASTCALVLTGAFTLDVLLGDPHCRWHPVRLIGAAAARIEQTLRTCRATGRMGGLALVIGTLAVTVGLYATARGLLARAYAPALPIFDALILYACIALRDMLNHAGPVARALQDKDLDAARRSVQAIVGRETDTLDRHGVARAAVESVAEGFVDGFFAPLFWFATGAVVGTLSRVPCLPAAVVCALAYRTVNTLDSMVGYRNERYRLFGSAAARLDDVLNFIPARLALPFLFLGALLCRLSPTAGWRTMLRDRLAHASPNAGHTESFAAGALQLRLGGPTRYPHGVTEKPWLGEGSPDAEPRHIHQVCRLFLCAGALATLATVLGLSVPAMLH